MFEETKETAYEQLQDCIDIMNERSFFLNPIKGSRPPKKDKEGNIIHAGITRPEANRDIHNRKGYDVEQRLLRKFKISYLDDLTKQEMDDVILLIHQSVIKG